MNKIFRIRNCAAILGSVLLVPSAFAQTNGSVSITATLSNLAVNASAAHWTVVWVTKADGTFVRTLRRDGESYGGHWGDHCSSYVAAVAGVTARTAVDGVTGATATTYAAPNSPLTETWNCKDAGGVTVPDGTYKIWIQYAEDYDGGQGPVTTNGLTWTKGATASTVTPPSQGVNFTNMSIVWTPGTATVTAPEIAVQQPVGSNLVDGTAKKSFGTVKVGKSSLAKTFTIKNTGTASLTGLAITKNGANAKEFVVTAPGAATLAPGASTTFKVTFKPKAKGARAAAIHIKSNDKDENPFDVMLSGQAAK